MTPAREMRETRACRWHIVSLCISYFSPLFFLSLSFPFPCVTDLVDVGLHIFNHFFLRILQSTRLSLPRMCLLSLFHYTSISFSLLPSPSYPRNARASHPEKWIFSFGKKGEKSIDSLHKARGSLAVRVQAMRGTERTPAVAKRKRRMRQKGAEERQKTGVKQRRSYIGKMKTAHLRTRSERDRVKSRVKGGKRERERERRVVSPGKWKFDDGRAARRQGVEHHPYYARVPHERGAKSTSNPLTEGNGRRKRSERDLSRHAADLKYRESADFLIAPGLQGAD